MRRLLQLTIIGFAVFAFVGFMYVQRHRDIDPLPSLDDRVTHCETGPFWVAVVGDSWVKNGKVGHQLHSTLAAAGLSVTDVRSFGEGGAKSRKIYRNLHAPTSHPYSSADVLGDTPPRYGVFILGVNDTAQHMGGEFYSQHVLAMTMTLMNSGIQPLVVEVPEYGIEHTKNQSMPGWVRAILYRYLFDSGEIDVIHTYRDALRSRLQAEGLAERIVLVDPDRVADDYHEDVALFGDTAHLNTSGSHQLGDLIAEHIVQAESKCPPQSVEENETRR